MSSTALLKHWCTWARPTDSFWKCTETGQESINMSYNMRNSVQVFRKKNERVDNQILEQDVQRGCQISILGDVQNRWTRPLNNKYVWICLNLTRQPVRIPVKLNCLWHQSKCNRKKLHLAITTSFFKHSKRRTAFHVYQTQLHALYFS